MDSSIREQAQLLQDSGYLEAEWYRDQYPDVARLGMDPAQHYLKFGARLGRDPSPMFHTRFYAKAHLAGKARDMNPLLHYVLRGRRARLPCCDPARDPTAQAQARVDVIRGKLFSLGFTHKPLAELNALAQLSGDPAVRFLAARELALWSLREKTEQGYRSALEHVATARRAAPDLDNMRKLVAIELLSHFLLGQIAEGHAAYERAALAGEVGPDAMLAWSNFQSTPELKLVWINEVLRDYHIPELALLPDEAQPAYDRLTCGVKVRSVADGPRVTVLVAAYEAAEMIATALRSLKEQTWRNLDILVIDDCSPSQDMQAVVMRFAQADPRIRLIRMEVNGGAYIARNRGLDAATGEFVTIHDADDWSHPQKIERQVCHLLQNPNLMGCTSEQARTLDDLSFLKLRSGGSFITFNTSSFLFRREPVKRALGYWDTVRFGADNEFIRRVQKVFGKSSVTKLATGPLSFQRDSVSSITSDPIKGIDGAYHYYGVRRDYFDAQLHYHKTASNLRYLGDPRQRPFPVSPMMLPEQPSQPSRFDVVFLGELRQPTLEVVQLAERIRNLRRKGRRVGLVETYDYNRSLRISAGMCAELRSLVDGDFVRVLVYGEEVETRALVKVGEGADLADMRFAPILRVINSASS